MKHIEPLDWPEPKGKKLLVLAGNRIPDVCSLDNDVPEGSLFLGLSGTLDVYSVRPTLTNLRTGSDFGITVSEIFN
jgi:hypothetical protein